MPSSKTKQLIFSIAISLGLVGGLFFVVDWESFLKSLEKINFWYFPLMIAIVVASFWVRALRWRYILPAKSSYSTIGLFDSISVSFLASFILPFRAGEIIRAFALQKWEGVPFTIGFASVVVERVLDVLVVLFLLYLGLLEVDSLPKEVTSAAYALGIFAGVIAAGIFCAFIASDFILGLFSKIVRLCLGDSKFSEKLIAFASGIIEGLKGIQSLDRFLKAIFWSFVLWSLVLVFVQLGLSSFGEEISFAKAASTTSIVALAVAVPSAPGFIGTYHAGCWLSLTGVWKYSSDFSVAFAIVQHFANVFGVFISGFLVLHRRKTSLADLRGG